MKKLFLLLAAVGMLFTACESGIEDEAPVFVVKGLEDIVDGENDVVVDSKGGEIVLEVSTNIEYTINIPAEAESWISVTETRAVEDVSLTIVVEENDSFESRSATVQILDSEDKELFGVTISQEGADKVFVVKGLEDIVDGENGVVVDSKGGEIVLEVSTNIEYIINIPAEAESWISVTDTRAVEDVSLTIVVEENDSFESRSATVQILDSEDKELFGVTISQNGIDKQDAIQFQDPEVKRICVENWDTNEDGELSYSEAIAVTDLGSLFSNSSISTFDELKYFTSLRSIGENAFRTCTSLTSIIIPENVTEIGKWAFSKSSSLTSITIPNSVVSIVDNPFQGCTSLNSFYGKYASSDNRCWIVDDELVAFATANLTSYTIPDGIISIGNNAFYGCLLESVTIPDSVTSIKDSAFCVCTSLKSITIPNSVTKLEHNVFGGCTSLASIAIPNSITEFGEQMFYNCASLGSVILPDCVTTIGYNTCYKCTSLTSVTIGKNVTMIEDCAFHRCPLLENIYCQAIIPPKGDYNMFKDISSDRKIYVPMASVAAYKAAEYWSDYAGAIVGYEF